MRKARVRVVCISDTHTLHHRVSVPDGDVLIHAGDFCGSGSRRQAREFAEYFAALPHRQKVVIAGNHDRCLEVDEGLGPRLFSFCHYLFDSGVEIDGFSFWGSPWQPEFLSWAFNLPRGPRLREKWDRIPNGTDILITHGPPQGLCDRTFSGQPVGCEELRAAIRRVRPRAHVFGHIHEGYGLVEEEGTIFVNASVCTLAYEPTNAPIVIELADSPMGAPPP
jgi:calcineurin-like phosphoesterase family protein